MTSRKRGSASKRKSSTTRKRTTAKAKVAKPNEVGDKVERVLESPALAPITKLAKQLFLDGDDCGCEERKKKLNKIFRRRPSRPRCLNEKDYNYLKDNLDGIKLEVKQDTMNEIARIHASAFNYHFSGVCSSCASRNRQMINDLKAVMDTYES